MSANYHWAIGPEARRFIFLALAFLWMLIWYHRVRVRYEDESSAKFTLSIQQIMCNGLPLNGEYVLIFIVTVKNIGALASALPTWKIFVRDGDRVTEFVPTLFEESITMSGANGFQIAYGEDEAIYNKTAVPLPRGAFHHGWAAAVSTEKWFGQLGPQHTIGIKCWDVFGNVYETSRPMGSSHGNSSGHIDEFRKPMHFPGLRKLKGG